MEVPEQLLEMIWAKLGEPTNAAPVVTSSKLEHTVHTITSVARTDEDLVTAVASVEWSAGSPVITYVAFARVPLGTVAYMADEWREEVGA